MLTGRQRDRNRAQRARQTDRQRQRDRDRAQRARQTDRQRQSTESQADRQRQSTESQADRQTDKDRETETERGETFSLECKKHDVCQARNEPLCQRLS